MCVDAAAAVPRDRPDAPSTAADASFHGRDLLWQAGVPIPNLSRWCPGVSFPDLDRDL